MARTTSTNFTAGLDFTVATASTDLFKKEDVQVLAQAVDQHDHSTGKGLALAAGSIPNGTITSAMIADGTIATSDIAASAVTQLVGSYAAAATFTTTTTGSWVATPVTTGSVACSGAPVRVSCSGAAYHSFAGGLISFGVMTDGAPGTSVMALNAPVANYLVPFAFEILLYPVAGNHTFTLGVVNGTAGTAGLGSGIASLFYATEVKR